MMRRLLLACALFATITPVVSQRAHAEEPVTLFAAASLKGALAQLAPLWEAQGHPALKVSLASSAALARQIQQGAPVQLFISADEKWMDYLAKNDMVVKSSRVDLLTNTLVLVSADAHGTPATVGKGYDLAGILGEKGKLAVGDPATVPAGIYGKQALQKLGLWEAASTRLAPAEDVKAALLLVEKGEAPAGIVYGTDAKGDKKVHVIGIFPASSHDPIVYPAALIAKHGETQEGRQALAFLRSVKAQAVFAKFGFGKP